MEMWIPHNSCTGCGGCSNICPQGAIIMKPDACGFIYPVINNTICINCGLCKKSCPIVEKPKLTRAEIPKVYAAWTNDPKIRFYSTSGGVFSELAKVILEEDGYVAGAQYTSDNMVEHTLIHSLDGLQRICQSKYIQSEPKMIYRDVKKRLNEGKFVAFCGSPCQVSALLKYLKSDPKNLLTIEFICRGMNSPKAYRSWLDEIEQNKGSKAVKVWFKYKENGWKRSPKCTRIDFADNSYQVLDGDENTFMSGYLGPNLYIRPSCGKCCFNGTPRQGDITVADFWGIDRELDDDAGTSMVLLNSKKGDCWYRKAERNLVSVERRFDEIRAGNVCFSKSVQINPKSGRFLRSLSEKPFSVQFKKYTKISLIRKVLQMIKRIICKELHFQ